MMMITATVTPTRRREARATDDGGSIRIAQRAYNNDAFGMIAKAASYSLFGAAITKVRRRKTRARATRVDKRSTRAASHEGSSRARASARASARARERMGKLFRVDSIARAGRRHRRAGARRGRARDAVALSGRGETPGKEDAMMTPVTD